MDMQSANTKRKSRSLAKALAPEDIRAGQYVGILYVVGEYFSCAALEEAAWKPVEPVRVRMMPHYTQHPMKVIDVCLPYVLAREADGDYLTLDVRRHRLARVTSRFGRTAAKRVRAQAKHDKSDDEDDD